MVTIEINNNRVKLSGNKIALNKLYKFLTFRHPNAFYIQKKIKYAWDGKVHPLSAKGYMATGLLERAVEFLREWEDEFEIRDYRVIPKFIGSPTKVGGLTLRDYQIKAVETLGNYRVLGQLHPRGIFLHGVGAGKTLILFAVHMAYQDARTLILLNNSVLYKQLKGDLKLAFPSSYGYMQGNSIKWGDIMVVMVATLKNRLKEYQDKLMDFNVLLTDEADLAINKTFEFVYSRLFHIPIRVGFTGTAFMRDLAKDKLKNTAMIEVFGEVLTEVTMKELEDRGINTRAIIKLISGGYTDIEYGDYKKEFDNVISFNRDRHEIIAQRITYNILCHRKHIMVFTKYIAQAESLFDYLKAKHFKGMSIGLTHHKAKGNLLQQFKDGKLNILVTTLYLKRGLNLPLTDVIINASDGDYYSNPIQILGRGVRRSQNKEVIYYEDILDHGVYLSSHAKSRIKYYKQLHLEIRDLRLKK